MLKKIALIGSAMAVLGLPVIASADLVTANHTNEYSSVRVQTGICPTRTTPPQQTLSTPISQVRTICGNPLKRTGTCAATVFASDNCSGAPVANVTIDLSDAHIVGITNLRTDTYNVHSDGSSTVTIDYSH